MNQEEFEKIFERQVEQSRTVLLMKAREYATDEDRLHNFHVAAVLTQGTPEQALWGFLVKHLVSISDMVNSQYAYTEALWEEKIGDAINYLILLRAQVIESNTPYLSPRGENVVHKDGPVQGLQGQPAQHGGQLQLDGDPGI